jgi:hypothetical protein
VDYTPRVFPLGHYSVHSHPKCPMGHTISVWSTPLFLQCENLSSLQLMIKLYHKGHQSNPTTQGFCNNLGAGAAAPLPYCFLRPCGVTVHVASTIQDQSVGGMHQCDSYNNIRKSKVHLLKPRPYLDLPLKQLQISPSISPPIPDIPHGRAWQNVLHENMKRTKGPNKHIWLEYSFTYRFGHRQWIVWGNTGPFKFILGAVVENLQRKMLLWFKPHLVQRLVFIKSLIIKFPMESVCATLLMKKK